MVVNWKTEKIKLLRKRLRLSQEAFGEILGVSRNYIYYLERGEREPSKTLRLLLDCIEKEHEKGG
jgi:DNA-binding transcriptional regulator YiaG